MTTASEPNNAAVVSGGGRSDPASKNRLDELISTTLTISAFVFAVIMLLLFAISAFAWREQPFLGVRTARTLVVNGALPVAAGEWEGYNAGIRRLDVLTSLNGQPLDQGIESGAGLNALLGTLSVGQIVTVEFERPVTDAAVPIYGRELCDAPQNGAANCRVTYALGEFPGNDFLASFAISFFSGLVVLGAGIFAFVMRPQQTAARLLAVLAALTAVFLGGFFDFDTTYLYDAVWLVALTLIGGAVMSFALVFPVKHNLVYRTPSVRWMPFVASAFVAVALSLVHRNPPNPSFQLWTPVLAVAWAALGLVVFVVMLINRRRHAQTIIVRDQCNTMLIGFGLAMIFALLFFINGLTRSLFGSDLVPLNVSAATPLLILPILSIAYAVIQYRSTNTDRILTQTFTYGLMLFALVIGYFLIVLSSSLLVRRMVAADDPVFIAAIIFGLAVLFLPVRNAIQRRIDAVYFRRRIENQQYLETFSQQVSSLVSVSDIVRAYHHQLDEAVHPSSVFVFLPDRQSGDYAASADAGSSTDVRFAPDSPLITYLSGADDLLTFDSQAAWTPEVVSEKSRLQILRARVMAGLRGSNRLNGFVCIGAPRSGTSTYTFEEARFIQTLTTQVGVAIERALVIDSLERRVRELDVLSQVSQAANFNVEFDALLELIVNQMSKLIDAPYVYITLREPASNEIYHAFFLEGDERDRSRENRRWSLGRDLFSDVIRTGRMVRVTNYAAEMARRGTRGDYPQFEDPTMRAFVAVPMNAGSGVLGVLAVGTPEEGVEFSDEQVKFLTDVTALAATSIDKARLFGETNARARQLQALNDISRQIVASEAKLEELLNLITGSATTILNAEAGSLLLTADDGSRDLVFRVVIGGSGADLVGVRLTAGKGLVGEVASLGRPIIVNDVKSDARWSGELTKGAFNTKNVLAVPLNTPDGVIGVLEVLNKVEGRFTADDVELLTTFAGQAAVAIENARLFQQTDLALTERVSELETLERIDIELTRSLDLRKVAEITVTWAIENSSATAGMLGLVAGDPPALHLIYATGYEHEDLPDGTEGDVLPLTRGISSRVLRTRQAEVVPDVNIDRDYIPSLRGAISQITLPMLSGGVVNALLILETNREPRLRLADMPFLTRLTEHASIAIVNAQLYAEITRANQSKNEFVSFVAHELKNPLAVIRGYSDAMLGSMAAAMSDQQRLGFIATIRSTADRMTTLVSDLNDVTKLETNNMRMQIKPMDFREVIEETVNPFRKAISEKDQTISVEIEDGIPMVNGDHDRLIQVLTNLVSNAHKYTKAGGTITVGAAVDTQLRDRKGRPLPAMLHVRVSDNGIGMSEDDLSKLFKPYFRSENEDARAQPGTGLGLTITQGIIRQHGGDIWAESTINVGTTFHFTLTLAQEVVGK